MKQLLAKIWVGSFFFSFLCFNLFIWFVFALSYLLKRKKISNNLKWKVRRVSILFIYLYFDLLGNKQTNETLDVKDKEAQKCSLQIAILISYFH